MARQHIEEVWASGGDQGTTPSAGDIAIGWLAEEPPFQKFNYVLRLITEFLEHIEQQGIGQWDARTSYTNGGFAIGTNRVLYVSQIGGNIDNDPVSDDGSRWLPFVRVATDAVAGIIEIATQAEADAGVDGTRAITPLTLAGRTATTERTGLVELATNAEVAALTDPLRVVTAAALGALSATEGQPGILALASAAEVAAGVNSTKAVTPDKFFASSNLAANGYIVFPKGLTLQWGTTNFTAPSLGTNIALPLAFPNNFWACAVAAPVIFLGGSGNTVVAGAEPNGLNQIAVSCGAASVGTPVDVTWFALGN